MQKKNDWNGLRALWRGGKRWGAVLAMATVGSLCGAAVAAVLTLYVYMIGSSIGFVIGLVVGARLGLRMAPRDASLVFVLSALSARIAYAAAAERTDDGLLLTAASAAGYVAMALLALGWGNLVPVKVRYPTAIAASWCFGIFSAYWIVRGLWFSD